MTKGTVEHNGNIYEIDTNGRVPIDDHTRFQHGGLPDDPICIESNIPTSGRQWKYIPGTAVYRQTDVTMQLFVKDGDLETVHNLRINHAQPVQTEERTVTICYPNDD